MIGWKITRITADGDVILDCHYVAFVNIGSDEVKTEGNWTFSDKIVLKPLAEMTEQDVIDKIRKESTINNECIIESRLMEQLEKPKNQHLPWLPPVFTIGA
jgi:hypothetical protein